MDQAKSSAGREGSRTKVPRPAMSRGCDGHLTHF
jgi:hypothetical protein